MLIAIWPSAEHRASREPAGAHGRRAVQVEEQPLVGPELAVEPHHVVEARHHEALRSRARVRHRGGAEQRDVRHVRADGRVHERIVGERAVGAEPHVLVGRARPVGGPRVATGEAHVDRPLPRPRRRGLGVLLVAPRRRLRDLDRLGRGDVGHRVGVVGALLGHVERRRHVEDRLAVLDRDDPPGGEAAAVADAVDVEDDRHVGSPGRRKYACIEWTTRPASTVRPAAIRPCASTWPPKIRSRAFCGLTPRNRLTSSCSSSRRSTRSSIGVPTTANLLHPRKTLAVSSRSGSTVFRVPTASAIGTRTIWPHWSATISPTRRRARRRSPRCRSASQDPVERGGRPAPQHVTEDRHPRLEPRTRLDLLGQAIADPTESHVPELVDRRSAGSSCPPSAARLRPPPRSRSSHRGGAGARCARTPRRCRTAAPG